MCNFCFRAQVKVQTRNLKQFIANDKNILCPACFFSNKQKFAPYFPKKIITRCDDLTLALYLDAKALAEEEEKKSLVLDHQQGLKLKQQQQQQQQQQHRNKNTANSSSSKQAKMNWNMALGSKNAATHIKHLSRSLVNNNNNKNNNNNNNNNRSSQQVFMPRNLNNENKSSDDDGYRRFEEKSYDGDNFSNFREANRVKEAFGFANIDNKIELDPNSEKTRVLRAKRQQLRRVNVDEKDNEEDPFALEDLYDSKAGSKLLLMQRFDGKERDDDEIDDDEIDDDELFNAHFSDYDSSDGGGVVEILDR